MARSQRSKIRQRRRAPIRAKYKERQKQALILKHQLLAAKEAVNSKVMEVVIPPEPSEIDSRQKDIDKSKAVAIEHEAQMDGKEVKNSLSKSKLKKIKEARKRKKLRIKKGQWKWT